MTKTQIKRVFAQVKPLSAKSGLAGLLSLSLFSLGLARAADPALALEQNSGLVPPKTAEAPKVAPKPAPKPAPAQPDCKDPNSTIEINYCAAMAYKAADKLLNQTYQQLIATLKDPEKSALIAAEQAWIPFRDANCKARVASSLGGTGYSGFLSTCLTSMTQTRTAELKNWNKDR
jgi:uncharacterized protein YecT (DUF1311 family)